ncbi:ATP-binding protein [Adlercreutzia sp. R21]|uniref:ATP-binding protein n=1 Tax=Adlercreutzia wanghongyangiae TaxID=3111451 RepID=UPI002DBA9E94|nr:ATP-binding protein [Adlercreutzia sp. R21]MEC4183773.1 ATP-binding protein [Adlercreutzia sp. R21]
MKKADVLTLIRSHYENDESAFRHQSIEIAREFEAEGNESLADFVMALLNNSNAFVPQSLGGGSDFLVPFERADHASSGRNLLLPQTISREIEDIIGASSRCAGINKFLFYGEPGTGKTEAVKEIARTTERDLYYVALAQIVDSHLGQTAKNIDLVFREINNAVHPEKIMVLFDELDALALTRINSNDVREMGRATTAMFKGLDDLNDNVLLFATTNLFSSIDKALVRRFDLTVSFDNYTREDLEAVAASLLEEHLPLNPYAAKGLRTFRKILKLFPAIPAPGDLQNMIKVAVAFSSTENPYDYLRRFYRSATGNDPDDIVLLKDQGFTVREIEQLTSVPKSTVSRKTSERK